MIQTATHIPVLINSILKEIEPVSGIWLDGTFGAGGYSRALLEAGATKLLAVDRDPSVFDAAQHWAKDYGTRLELIAGEFGNLEELATALGAPALRGVVLDIGISSMQIDQADRGFSFMKDGPLDMRMAQEGPTAADIVNGTAEETLAGILYYYGEERASRRIARNIVAARRDVPILTTLQLSEIIEKSLPRPKPGQIHPATRSFQALRIAVNDELGQLAKGLSAAEAVLATGGILAVVSFHSLEDRIVKKFIQMRSGATPAGSRHAPARHQDIPRFARMNRKAITADAAEIAANPRARSAKLRLARRLDAPAEVITAKALGLPDIDLRRLN